MNNRISKYSLVIIAFLLTVGMINLVSIFKKSDLKNNANKDTLINLDQDIDVVETNSTIQTGKETASINNTNFNTQNNTKVKLSFSMPCKGDVIIPYSPDTLIYDELLEQYSTTNSTTFKATNFELIAPCDGKIVSITTSNDYKKEIQLMTIENHIISLKGYFSDCIIKEGAIVIKGNTLAKIDNTSPYVSISIFKDDNYIDPISLLSNK